MVSNVGLVGWNSKNATGALLPRGETAAVAATEEAVLSCEGRQSRNSSTAPTRGVWLSEGRLTRLANITVTGVNYIAGPLSGPWRSTDTHTCVEYLTGERGSRGMRAVLFDRQARMQRYSTAIVYIMS